MKTKLLKITNLTAKAILTSIMLILIIVSNIPTMVLAAEGDATASPEQTSSPEETESPDASSEPSEDPSEEPSEEPSEDPSEEPTEESSEESEDGVLEIEISYTDLKIDLNVKSITQITNGVSSGPVNQSNSKLGKTEVYRKKVDSTKIKMDLEVTITNDGNASGIVEELYTFLPKAVTNESTEEWEEVESNVLKYKGNQIEIEPNESETVEISIQGNDTEIMGTSDMSVMLISNDDIDQRIIQKNKNLKITGFKDVEIIKTTNNYDIASAIVSISTGLKKYIVYIIITLLVLLIISAILIIRKKRK